MGDTFIWLILVTQGLRNREIDDKAFVLYILDWNIYRWCVHNSFFVGWYTRSLIELSWLEFFLWWRNSTSRMQAASLRYFHRINGTQTWYLCFQSVIWTTPLSWLANYLSRRNREEKRKKMFKLWDRSIINQILSPTTIILNPRINYVYEICTIS